MCNSDEMDVAGYRLQAQDVVLGDGLATSIINMEGQSVKTKKITCRRHGCM